MPRGEILFAGTQVIPAKINTDESLWTLQCNFPRNWVFRIVELRIWATMDDMAAASDWANGMSCLVSSDEDSDWMFPIQNVSHRFTGTDMALKFTFISVSPSFIEFFMPDLAVDAPIRTGQGSARLFIRWVDNSGDSTVAVTTFFRIRALMYDVDQDLSWAMHTPVPIIGT